MRRQSVTLRPFRSRHHPEFHFVVYWPADSPGKPRRSRRFKSEPEAKRFKEEKEIEALNYGRRTAALTESAKEDAAWAATELQPHGLTLRDALIDFLAARHHLEGLDLSPAEAARQYASADAILRGGGGDDALDVSLADAVRETADRARRARASQTAEIAVDELIAQKENDEKSARYLTDLRSRLGRFVGDFAGRRLSEVTTDEINAWLRSLPVGATTRNNYRTALAVLFGWAQRTMGYCDTNPVTNAAKAKQKREAVAIFTPAELRVILEASPAPLLPFFALGAFAGLRSAEIYRLTWEKIDFPRGRIEIDAEASKTAGHRFVPINDTLRAWLHPVAGTEGSVCPLDPAQRLRRFRRTLDRPTDDRPAVAWKHNALRHSFASYTFAQIEDAGRLAAWLGHESPRMIFKHYRERVTPEDAAAYFAVRPQL